MPGVRAAGAWQVVDRGAPPGARGFRARPDDRALPAAPRHRGAKGDRDRADDAPAAGAVEGAAPGSARAGLARLSRRATASGRGCFAFWGIGRRDLSGCVKSPCWRLLGP